MYVSKSCAYCPSQRVRLIKAMHNVAQYECVKCKRRFKGTPPEPVPVTAKPERMKYYIRVHQGKCQAFADALDGEFERVLDVRKAEICFYDYDAIIGSDKFENLKDKAIFIFPHRGGPSVIGDIYPTSPHTVAQFVSAQGHVDIMRAWGYEKPLIVTGWHLTPVCEFRPSESQKPKVLFAPIHPRMSEMDKNLNSIAHKILADLHRKGEIDLTVRYIASLALSGIQTMQYGVQYCEGSQDSSNTQMLDFDLLVASQTYAYKGVALGVPTLMMGEAITPHNFSLVARKEKMVFAKSWSKYRDMMMYPCDLLATDKPLDLIHEAMQSDDKIRDWKKRMIGDPFDGNIVLRTVRQYLNY